MGRKVVDQGFLGMLTYLDLTNDSQRGSATGPVHQKGSRWRMAQRERLHFLSHPNADTMHTLLLDRTGSGGLVLEEWRVNILNEWLDVSLAGGPIQVSYLQLSMFTV